jgi:CheY-like chemotaxis protein
MFKVLIVDDDALCRHMLEAMVSREGYLASVVSNGNEALQAIARQPQDLIITDIIMPHKNGIELIMELFNRGDQTPIIAVSGGPAPLAWNSVCNRRV